MLHYNLICKNCGELQKRIHVDAWQVSLLYEKAKQDKCFNCGSEFLSLELQQEYRFSDF